MNGNIIVARNEPMEIVPNPNYFGMDDIERMAGHIAKSNLFGVKRPEEAVALMLIAQAEGKHPATIARDFDLIQGRPAKKPEAMLRDFIAAGGKVVWHELSDDRVCATFSHPSGGEVMIDWDNDRVQQAGLSGKEMHRKYPRQMKRARCIGEGVRTVFPGATSGVYTPEEVTEFPDEAPTVSRTEQAKQLVKDKAKAAPEPKKVENTAKPKTDPEPDIIDADVTDSEELTGIDDAGDAAETQPEPEPEQAKPASTDEIRRARLGQMVDHCCEAFGYEREHAAKVVLPAFLSALSKKPKDVDDEGVFNVTMASLKKKQKVQIEALVKAHQKKVEAAAASK